MAKDCTSNAIPSSSIRTEFNSYRHSDTHTRTHNIMSELLGRPHIYHCNRFFGTNPDSTDPEEFAKRKQYIIESAQRRMLLPQPIEPVRQSSMTFTLATEDSDGPCPVTNMKKKRSSKNKDKRNKSKPRRSGSRHSLGDHRDGSHKRNSNNNNNNIGEVRSLSGLEEPTMVSPLVSPSGKESKKKKRSKKFRYNSEALGVVIIPDCDDAAATTACCDDAEKEVQNKSAQFSSVTDLTQMLDDDDCTAFTKETAVTKDTTASKDTAMSKDTSSSIAVSGDTTVTNSCVFKDTEKHSKKSSKKAKKLNKEKRTKSKSKTRRSSRLNMHNDNNSTKIETSNHGSQSGHGSGHGNGNESWGDDPEGDKTFMSQELLSLLALQIDDDSDHNTDSNNNGRHSLTKPPSNSSMKQTPPPPCLKKSNSFSGPKKTRRSLGARNSSVGNLNEPRSMETKTKDRPLRSKRFQDATNGTKNESWEPTPSTTSSNRSPASSSVYSAGLLNLYTASKKSAPSQLLRRNVKSFSHVPAGESWRADPKRDDDIPSILFLSPENSHCNLMDESSSLGNSSNRRLSSSSTRRKKSIRRSSTSTSAAAAVAAAAADGGDNEELQPQPLSSTAMSGSVSGPLRRKSSTSKDNSCTTTSVGGSTPPRTMRRKSHNSKSSHSFRTRKNLTTDPASTSLRRNESWAANTLSNQSPGSSSKPKRSSNAGSMRRKKSPSGNKNESWGMAGIFSESRENLKMSGKQQQQQQKPPSMISSNLVGMLMSDTGASPKAAELYRSKHQQQQNKSPSAMKKSMSLGAMKHSPSLSTIKKSIANFKKFRGGTRNELKSIPNIAN